MPVENKLENQIPPEILQQPGIAAGVYHHDTSDLVTNDMLTQGNLKTRNGNPIDSDFIVKTTRIRERYHVSTPDAEVDMGGKALTEALAQKGWNINDLDFLIIVTSWNTQESTAQSIYDQISTDKDSPRKPTLLHTWAACSGFAQTLHLLNSDRDRFEGKRIGILATEHYSQHVEGFEKAIFGDGAGALVGKFGRSSKKEHSKEDKVDFDVIGSSSITYAELKNNLLMRVFKPADALEDQCLYFLDLPHPENQNGLDFEMDGPAVFKFTQSEKNYASAIAALADAGLAFENIDVAYTHQANGRGSETILKDFKRKGFNGRFPSNVEMYGNTSSVSMLLLLNQDLQEGKINRGTKALFMGFGAGLQTTSAILIFK